MKSIAVVYATREGHTRKIADRAAAELTRRGLIADVRDARDPGAAIDTSIHSAAILAASVHLGKHESEMVRFVRKYRRELDQIPSAFLSVTLSEAGVERPGQTPQARARAEGGVKDAIDRFIRDTGWHPAYVRPLAGALLYAHYNPLVRFVMKQIAKSEGADTDTSREYEYTDWAGLDHFVDDFAHECVETPTTAA